MKTSQLEDILSGNPSEICLLDARDRDHYQNSHITGAINLNWSQFCKQAPDKVPDIYKQTGWWGDLKSRQELKSLNINVDFEKHIVIYGDGAKTKGRDCFLGWLLYYLGTKNISILDGGWTEWARGARENSKKESATTYHGTQKLNFRKDLFVSAEELDKSLKNKKGIILIDTRSEEEFSGVDTKHLKPNGHIDGAILLEYRKLYDSDGSRFLTRPQFMNLPEVQQLLKADSSVAYCEMGLRAATLALLVEIYARRTVRVLDGGIFSWTLKEERSIV